MGDQAVIGIGNSDNKLPQRRWFEFIEQIRFELAAEHCQIHGEWFSAPASPWQNAGWCIDVPEDDTLLKRHLSNIAREFEQDSISYLRGETEFLEPTDD